MQHAGPFEELSQDLQRSSWPPIATFASTSMGRSANASSSGASSCGFAFFCGDALRLVDERPRRSGAEEGVEAALLRGPALALARLSCDKAAEGLAALATPLALGDMPALTLDMADNRVSSVAKHNIISQVNLADDVGSSVATEAQERLQRYTMAPREAKDPGPFESSLEHETKWLQ